jgi:AcrR family transcriptional regulator
MGRRQTIDRGTILDAAEHVVLRDGAAHLTIDAVAAEAGVSKGGVLYAYATKDILIDAMLERVVAAYDELAEQFLAKAGDHSERHILAHVQASAGVDPTAGGRAAALMASFIRSPQFRNSTIDYYRGLFARIDPATERGRRARLALLAAEGAFTLRGFGLYPFTDADWQAIHDDIIAVLLS